MDDIPNVCEFLMKDLSWALVSGFTWDGVAVINANTSDHSIVPMESLSDIFSVDKISVYKIIRFTLQGKLPFFYTSIDVLMYL